MKWTVSLLFIMGLLGCKTVGKSQSVSTQQMAAEGMNLIRTIKLHRSGDQTSFPMIALGSQETLELHFDDLAGNIKNYYYTLQLCNLDWSPGMLHSFEYLKGFQTVRITNYRNSSLSSTRYTHYQATIPDRNSVPNKSGNYLLKVFLNNDTTQLVFTKRFVIVDNKTAVAAQLQQPFNSQFFRSHQKLQIAVTTDNRTQVFSPQDLKVVVLQNNNWTTSLYIDRPTIYRGNYYEYSDESITAMPAGKEWRWIDIRSLRLMSDRMESINTKGDTTHVYVKKESSRNGQVYVYYRDLNGTYSIEAMESVNPFWQGEYGLVHFTYIPPGNRAFDRQDVHLFGELTDYATGDEGKMNFNDDKGWYEKTLYLKQGFYNYTYVTLPRGGSAYPDFGITEGNNWSTENSYTILVYHRPFGARADELIGAATTNSAFQRGGF